MRRLIQLQDVLLSSQREGCLQARGSGYSWLASSELNAQLKSGMIED